jgi:hypothetical protein
MKPQSGAAPTRRVRRTEVEWSYAGAFDCELVADAHCVLAAPAIRLMRSPPTRGSCSAVILYGATRMGVESRRGKGPRDE